MKMFIVVLLTGFIPTLFFSWAFELSSEGLKKGSKIDNDRLANNYTSKKLDIITLVAVMVVALMLIADRFYTKAHFSSKPETLGINEQATNSIAVLPFIDLFEKAMQVNLPMEFITVLVRIPKLKVAGRISSFSFKGRNEDLKKLVRH